MFPFTLCTCWGLTETRLLALILYDPITLKFIYYQILAPSSGSFKTEWLSHSASGRPALTITINTVSSDSRWKYFCIKGNVVHFLPQTNIRSVQLRCCQFAICQNERLLEAAEKSKCWILQNISKYQMWTKQKKMERLWAQCAWCLHTCIQMQLGFMFCINEKVGPGG